MDIRKTKRKNEYRQLSRIPSKTELETYYKKIYFQQSKGSYEKKYSKEEILYFKNNAKLLALIIKKLTKTKIEGKTFLDLGAGEGWIMSYFHSIGAKVTGVDLSILLYGVKKFNRHIIKYFVQEDMFNYISMCQKKSIKYDFINLRNVIEHVIHPEELLKNLKSIIKKKGLICVTFPNDYSPIQKFLYKTKKVNCEYWISYPDHISYFNKHSFLKMADRLGYKTVCVFSDFLIDIFLMNDYSNYVIDKNKGKEAHNSRINFINLACKIDLDITTNLLINLGELGLGRNLTVILK